MQTFLQRLKDIDQYIQLEVTGSPAELGEKIGVSERTVYDYLRLMRQYGARIKYFKERRTYCYNDAGHFVLGFIPEFSGKETVN